MAKPLAVPTPWATTANFPAEVYPAEYPPGHPLAGTAHPQAGQAVPWSTEPTKDAALEAAYAAVGHHPGKPLLATAVNSRESKIDSWLAWVLEGTNTPDETAHIVETDGSGQIAAFSLYVQDVAELDGGLTCNQSATFGTSISIGEYIQGKLQHRGHTSGTAWILNTWSTSVSDASSGTVPGGGGVAVTLPVTHATTPSATQILFPDDSLLFMTVTITVSNADASQLFVARYNSSWKREAGVLTFLADDTATCATQTIGVASGNLLPNAGQLDFVAGATAGGAGAVLRCAYAIEAFVMPIA
jgi:hypothetical protein